eukprot:6204614-Pleurochrysis_carterae.AAC.1
MAVDALGTSGAVAVLRRSREMRANFSAAPGNAARGSSQLKRCGQQHRARRRKCWFRPTGHHAAPRVGTRRRHLGLRPARARWCWQAIRAASIRRLMAQKWVKEAALAASTPGTSRVLHFDDAKLMRWAGRTGGAGREGGAKPAAARTWVCG